VIPSEHGVIVFCLSNSELFLLIAPNISLNCYQPNFIPLFANVFHF